MKSVPLRLINASTTVRRLANQLAQRLGDPFESIVGFSHGGSILGKSDALSGVFEVDLREVTSARHEHLAIT
jgi:hypothetical protein